MQVDARAFKDAIIWFGIGDRVLQCCSGHRSGHTFRSSMACYGSHQFRWHEYGHRTAFKTEWMNNVVHLSFILIRNPVVWKANHVRHPLDTVIVGRDPEIVAFAPDLRRIALNHGPCDTLTLLQRMALHVTGRLHSGWSFLRSEDHPRVFRVAGSGCSFISSRRSRCGSDHLAFMLIGLPVFTGHGIMMTGLLQHLGLAENVTDHRLNTRTVH